MKLFAVTKQFAKPLANLELNRRALALVLAKLTKLITSKRQLFGSASAYAMVTMIPRFRLVLLTVPVVVGCWLASEAAAATLSGMSLPDSYVVNGQILVLNGMGLRTLTFLHIRAYVAALYVPKINHDAQQILKSPDTKVVILKFIRSGSKERVERQYRAGEAANCGSGGCNPADQADFERLVAAAPAVEPGDTSTYVFTPNGIQVFANSRLIGDFANRDLAYRLLAGFIGEHPPSQKLRRQLLGLPTD